jgi:hypothetical protein
MLERMLMLMMLLLLRVLVDTEGEGVPLGWRRTKTNAGPRCNGGVGRRRNLIKTEDKISMQIVMQI